MYGKQQQAETVFRRSIELYAMLAADFPEKAHFRRDLADAYNNLGVVLREQSKIPSAEQAFRKAIELGEMIVAQKRNVLLDQTNLAASYHNLGNVVRDLGDPKASLAWYGKAIQLLEPIKSQLLPATAKRFLGNAYWDRANARGQLAQRDKAIEDWQQAIRRYAVPEEEALRHFLATAKIEKELAAKPKLTGKVLYQISVTFVRALKAAIKMAETSLQQQYTIRTLDFLKQAKTAGYFADAANLQQFKADPEFDLLRKDPAFLEFEKSLKAGK
jgi:tetratricopeptide (TPR) repeat protein